MSEITQKPKRTVRFQTPERPPSLFHTLTDEFLIQVGKLLLPGDPLPIPSFRPHFENPKHPFENRLRYNDYLAFRETCHRVSYLSKPVKGNLEIEIKNKESFARWLKAPQDVLSRVTRLRLNFTLETTANCPLQQVHETAWAAFISLLERLPNLLELYLAATPFCWHGKHGQTLMFELPDSTESFPSIISFANETKCRGCAEHLTTLFYCMPKLKHVKCTSQDSVSQDDLMEDPYDIFCNLDNRRFVESIETLYLKYWDLSTFDSMQVQELNRGAPNLKKLVYSSHKIEQPYTLRQRARVEALSHPTNGQWIFLTTGDPDEDRTIFHGQLPDFADLWSPLRNMEEIDLGIILNIPQYTTKPQIPSGPTRNAQPDQISAESSFRVNVVGHEIYRAKYEQAMIAATKYLKTRWGTLKKVFWWEDRDKRTDSPTRDYLRWSANIVEQEEASENPIVQILIEGPERMDHSFTWSDDGSVYPEVEDPVDQRSPRS
ncbi:uncharacterized protein IL334_007162 [Kwoniella shivajii]|uniref:Uncharacterized protein n=1 Tax=Kwoniella shivajii TaxID=564305 RepID=A0ABZ1D8Q2_9TREE|nr:hypothetical protein IL334_007162 [Kwoniella shivajii]